MKLYFHYISIHIRSIMEYKASFFLSVIGQFLVTFNVLLGIYFLFERFSNIKGFTYQEVLLSFSVMLLEFSLAECIARGFDRFPNLVRKGEFDRILVRPRNEILQVLGSQFELSRLGRMLQAIIMFVYAAQSGTIEWNFLKVLTLIFMLIGGFFLFSGLFMIYATLSFFTLEGLEFMNIFTDGGREFGRYPVGVYGKWLLRFCTYIIPYALVQYYPLLYLIGRSDNVCLVFVPLLTILFLLPCYLLWKFGVRKYQSSGS